MADTDDARTIAEQLVLDWPTIDIPRFKDELTDRIAAALSAAREAGRQQGMEEAAEIVKAWRADDRALAMVGSRGSATILLRQVVARAATPRPQGEETKG